MKLMNKKQLEEALAPRVEIQEAEIDALWEIVESLPVDPHDMEVHFWCDHEDYNDE